MPIITKPYSDFVNNVDVADAGKVNAQINALYNLVNGSLDAANINTTGAPFSTYATKQTGTAPWLTPTLLNGWVNFGSGFGSAAYYKDDMGFVRLRGFLKSGVVTAGTIIFTLPASYRPTESLHFPTISSNASTITPGSIYMDTSGNLRVEYGVSNNLILNHISYRGEI